MCRVSAQASLRSLRKLGCDAASIRSPPSVLAGLERLRQTGLLQHCIRGVTGFNIGVDRKPLSGNWTFPNLVISFALSDKEASLLTQDIFELVGEAAHAEADRSSLYNGGGAAPISQRASECADVRRSARKIRTALLPHCRLFHLPRGLE